MSRIAARFDKLKKEGRAAFVPFIMAGDPDMETSEALLAALPGAGADLIELGVCFTDPMADGPVIEAAGNRALAAGQTLRKTLGMVREFRRLDADTPIILMGYYNPFFIYGGEAFARDAADAGVDGLIIVDLPPEEDHEMRGPLTGAGIDLVRLATPTTDEARSDIVLKGATGFVYYVSVAGVTGKRAGVRDAVAGAVGRLKSRSLLPVAVGFGIKTKEQAAETAAFADAVVVGSALVERLASAASEADKGVNAVLSLARDLSGAIRAASGDGK